MKKHSILKKVFSLILAVLICLMCAMPSLAAVTYPQSVTRAQAVVAIDKTDAAIKYILSSVMDTSLENIVLPELYKDQVLSQMLLSMYKMLEQEAGVTTLLAVNINISVQSVRNDLKAYPEVYNALAPYDAWNQVELTDVHWGVSDKEGFARAVSSMFRAFDSVLMALLCDDNHYLNPLVSIKGSNGYEAAIIPTLKALGCKSITDAATFYADAKENAGSMLYHIASDLLTFAETALDTPCASLSEALPSIATYLLYGGFDNAVATLVAPLRLQILNISTALPIDDLNSFISNPESYTQDFTHNLNERLSSFGIPLAEIDLELIASCGTANEQGEIISDKPDTFIIILRWLLDTVKLNTGNLGELVEGIDATTTEMVNKVLSKSTDELIAIFISLFVQTSGTPNPHQWTFSQFTAGAAAYTPNLSADKYQRVADGIDELLNQLIGEMGMEDSLGTLISKELYSSKTMTLILKTIYSALEGEEMAIVADLLGLDLTPYAIGSIIQTKGFYDEGSALKTCESWAAIGERTVDFNIEPGSRNKFANILISAISPLENVLGVFLAEDKIELFGAINFYGSDGYNTAIIPLYEALGCSADTISSYEDFKKLYDDGKGLEAILDPIFHFLDRLTQRPAYTLLEVLPNLLYFLEDGIGVCIKNIIYPLTRLLSSLGIEDAIDLSLITELDINALLTQLLGSVSSDITLPAMDVAYLASLGTQTQMTSKRTLNGQAVTVPCIKADMPGLCVTLLRYIADTMKMPENSSMITSMLKSDAMGELAEGEMGNLVMSFAQGIINDLNAMTSDEATEWLYKLFFRERATSSAAGGENYMPTIIYKPEKNYSGIIIAVLAPLLLAVGFFAYRKYKNRPVKEETEEESVAKVMNKFRKNQEV